MRLIDADALIEALDGVDFANEDDKARAMLIVDMRAALSPEQPDIIRCGECRYWDLFPATSNAPEYHECKRMGQRMHTAADDFCSRAERREVMP